MINSACFFFYPPNEKKEREDYSLAQFACAIQMHCFAEEKKAQGTFREGGRSKENTSEKEARARVSACMRACVHACERARAREREKARAQASVCVVSER